MERTHQTPGLEITSEFVDPVTTTQSTLVVAQDLRVDEFVYRDRHWQFDRGSVDNVQKLLPVSPKSCFRDAFFAIYTIGLERRSRTLHSQQILAALLCNP